MSDEPPRPHRRVDDEASSLAREWRRLGRAATTVALLISPAVFLLLYDVYDWQLGWALLGTLACVVVFRGGIDVLAHKLIPSFSGVEEARSRRRVWYWRNLFGAAFWAGVLVLIAVFVGLGPVAIGVLIALGVLLPVVPHVLLALHQVKTYEPDDAGWRVELDDVRGQAEAKLELARVISLWQSGEERERSLLLIGAPGTGKTMLSRAVATALHAPLVTLPGAASATFLDALVVRKSRRLAAKWGGRCIVFVDGIDVAGKPPRTGTIHDAHFYGPDGALTSGGDLVLETAAWRERLFALREAPTVAGGGGLAREFATDAPPLLGRARAHSVNAILDALYIVPARIFGLRLRLKPPEQRNEAVYFIGAGTAPLDTAPGRIISLRTPAWEDRRDIFDRYLAEAEHEPELDTGKARDELARITNGYSPAMIDQACSLALAYAHADERTAFNRSDLVEAMTTVETGVAAGAPYPTHRKRAIAIHEAGHAVCGHLYLESRVSTRLSIRKRGASGGQHQAMEIEERFGHWRSEQVGDLIWGLGAMAAEHVFYDQTTTGVGGDIGMVTWRAAQMVGVHGMGPAPIDLADRIADNAEREAAERRVTERFERLGTQLMHRSDTETEDPAKRALVAALLGQAFVVAWCTIRANRESTDAIAGRLVAAGELYGDEVTDLLDEAKLVKPDIDVLDETSWPVI